MTRTRSAIIVHYHEISLKGGTRPMFLRHLARNLERAARDVGPVRVRQLTGRIVLEFDDGVDAQAVKQRVMRVTGVANCAVAWRVPSTLEAMRPAVLRVVEERTFESFRITARRAFKTYPMTSVELNRELGALVQERTGARVDLHAPGLTVHVEVLPAETFVYADREPGPGGLPVGSGGTVAALLSGGIDSPVAAWRLMKRGCRVVFVHFHSVPYLPATSQEKARALVERLTQWQYDSRLYLVPFGEIQREVVMVVPPAARVVVYRRLMLRIGEALGGRHGAGALVTGESLGQVASQTLQNLARIDEVAAGPVLRPLIGMDKIEITAEAQRLGTYPISIIPDQDCCTLFTPRNPLTRGRLHLVEAAERALPTDEIVEKAAAEAIVEDFEFPVVGSPVGGVT